MLSPTNLKRQGEGGVIVKGYYKCSDYKDDYCLHLVTIMTIVFNGEQEIEQTIKSVINQTYDNLEYIVIGGGSTDGKIDYCKSSLNRSI